MRALSQNHNHHLPYLAQQCSRQAGVSQEEEEMDRVQYSPLNLTRTELQFVLGIVELILQKVRPLEDKRACLHLQGSGLL